jgi:hypothetical protein
MEQKGFWILGSFYMQKVLMALQQTQVASISRHVITVGEGPFRLSVLSSVPPLFYLIYSLHLGV